MNEEISLIANGAVLWLITIIAVGLVLFQTLIFLRKSFIAGKSMGVSDEKLKTAFRTGAISAFGPSMVIVIGMVSLLLVVGGPTALMRLAYIGNVAYELLAAQFSADAYGVKLTDANIPAGVFSTTLWAMAVGCIGWIVVTALITDKMDGFKEKLTGGRAKLLPIITSAAMLGAYGYLNAGYATSLDGNTVALVAGFLIMLAVTIMYRKTKMKFLNEWGLTIAMVGGVIIAAIV